MQPDGKLVLFGQSSGTTNGIVSLVQRLNANGTPDLTFGTGGLVKIQRSTLAPATETKTVADGLALGPDGSIYVGASVSDFMLGVDDDTFKVGVTKLMANGTPDPAFGTAGTVLHQFGATPPGGHADSSIRDIALAPDGKIVGAGEASDAAGKSRTLVVRFLADGTPDPSFGTGGGVAHEFADPASPTNLIQRVCGRRRLDGRDPDRRQRARRGRQGPHAAGAVRRQRGADRGHRPGRGHAGGQPRRARRQRLERPRRRDRLLHVGPQRRRNVRRRDRQAVLGHVRARAAHGVGEGRRRLRPDRDRLDVVHGHCRARGQAQARVDRHAARHRLGEWLDRVDRADLQVGAACKGAIALSSVAGIHATSAKAKRKAKPRRAVSYGNGTFSIAAGGHKTIKIHLTAAARSALKHHTSLKAWMIVTTKAGTLSRSSHRTITLRVHRTTSKHKSSHKNH